MEVIQIQYVPVPETAMIRDEFGRKLLKVAFCLEVANSVQKQNSPELSNAGKLENAPCEKLPIGLEWDFDDESRTVRYGETALTFRGERQYQLLKMVQQELAVNVRDVWKAVWKDDFPEWRTVRECGRQVTGKLSEAGIPYKISTDTCFVSFLENF